MNDGPPRLSDDSFLICLSNTKLALRGLDWIEVECGAGGGVDLT